MTRNFLLLGLVMAIAATSVVYFIKNNELKLNHTLVQVGTILPINQDKLQKILRHRFYIFLIDKEQVFPKKYSRGLEDVIKEKIGGFIERTDSDNPLFIEIFGKNNDKNKRIFSVIIITDNNARIVGIYLNKKLHELVDVLQLHPNLINLHLAGTAL